MGNAALTFDQQNVVMFIASNERFYGSIDKIGNDTVDGNTCPGKHDARLTCCHELRIFASIG